jgi:hypothetical protein
VEIKDTPSTSWLSSLFSVQEYIEHPKQVDHNTNHSSISDSHSNGTKKELQKKTSVLKV